MHKTSIAIVPTCLLLAGMGFAQVDTAWVRRYDGPTNDWDAASAIALDAAGNVYVTGQSWNTGSGTGHDYATVKYNSAGAQQWVARYNGPGNGSDNARAIAVDPAGNVYVTGESNKYADYINYDYATVKYNSAGVEQWVARYNGPGNGNDGAKAIAVDPDGNVYVTGHSPGGAATGTDYATIKYNSAGEQQWVTRYNGPVNGPDAAKAIAVDTDGNGYVTGFSAGSGTTYDYATVKYNSAGEQQWVARYYGPVRGYDYDQAIAVDLDGNVYVTGSSARDGQPNLAELDYATVKYNSAGAQQWVARYNGPGNDGDYGHAIAVDPAGNVYVTGASKGSGTAYSDYATVKYNSAGVEQWVGRYNGPANRNDGAKAIAVDPDGNVYVTGSENVSPTYDYATVKYNSAGVEQWVARYNGPGNSNDQPCALAVDAAGNVYVTGGSEGGSGGSRTLDYATIKYTQVPKRFDLLMPTNGAPGVAIAGDLTWEAAGGAEDYDVHLGTTSPPPLYAENIGNVTTYPYSGLANSTPYYWAVAAKNAYGNTRCNADFDFTTIAAAPSAFNLLTPLNHATRVAVAGDLTWEAATGATNYDVYLGTTSPPPLYQANVGNVTTFAYSGLANNTLYYWAVEAKNANPTPTRCTEDFDFTTELGIYRDVGALAIIAPAGTVKYRANITPACSLYNYGTNTETYTVRMKIGSSYNQTVTVTHAAGTKVYVTFKKKWSASPLGGPYAVTCSTELTGDANPANDKKTGSVTVTKTGVVNAPKGNQAGGSDPVRAAYVAVAPNLVAGSALVSFGLAEAGPVELALYDAAGVAKARLAQGVLPAGRHSCTLAAGAHGLVAGVYFLRFESGSVLITRKVLVE